MRFLVLILVIFLVSPAYARVPGSGSPGYVGGTMLRGFVILAALVAWAQLPLRAQVPDCNDRTSAMANLLENYGEQVVARGLGTNGLLFEVTVNKKTNAWSIIYSSPSGITCIAATGEDWRNVEVGPILGRGT